MASAISGFINQIENAVYGEQVRAAIVSALEACYSDVENPDLQSAAFQAAIEAAYQGGILDITEVTLVSKMTNENIIYRYMGSESGYESDTLYYYDGDKWAPIGSSECVEDAHALVYGGEAAAVPQNYEIGSFSNGEPIAASNRIRSKDFIDEDIYHVSANNGFSVLSYAYDASGLFVGYWNGTTYGPGTATYRSDFDLPSGYKYKLLIRNNSSDSITEKDAENVTYLRRGIIEKIDENSQEIENIKSFVGYEEQEPGESATYTYDEMVAEFGISYRDSYIFSTSVGQTIQAAVQSSGGDSTEIFVIPISGGSEVNYPVFRSSYGLGSCFADTNQIIISYLANSTQESGTQVTVTAPANARYFVLVLSPSLLTLKDSISLSVVVSDVPPASETEIIKGMIKATPNFLPYNSTLAADSASSKTLCAKKTKYQSEKLPFEEGFLFHDLNVNNGKIYYGSTLRDSEEVTILPFNPNLYFFGISPNHGTIIAGRRENQGSLYVYDGNQTHELFANASRKPYGWLYDTGIDFIVDGDGVEHCIFGEYAHVPSSSGLYVWRGTYPYTSESDWEQVKFISNITNDSTQGSIRHFHQVRRDPWTDILYLTSGDNPNQLNWWYSTDYGESWTLLFNDSTLSWESSTARCCNLIFTEDYIYWGSDYGENHSLNRIARGSNGIIDPSTRKKLCDLPYGYATNSICYVEHLNALFCYDRVDGYTRFESLYGKPLSVNIWLIDFNALVEVAKLPTKNEWGGHRGKCYVNYTSGQNPFPALGFSADTPTIFTFIGASAGLGTLFYDL